MKMQLLHFLIRAAVDDQSVSGLLQIELDGKTVRGLKNFEQQRRIVRRQIGQAP